MVEKVMEMKCKQYMYCKNADVTNIRCSIVASIPACHAGDRGSIPRDGVLFATPTF